MYFQVSGVVPLSLDIVFVISFDLNMHTHSPCAELEVKEWLSIYAEGQMEAIQVGGMLSSRRIHTYIVRVCDKRLAGNIKGDR